MVPTCSPKASMNESGFGWVGSVPSGAKPGEPGLNLHMKLTPLDLGSDQIRLLHLQPTDERGAPRVTLEPFALNGAPPYVALSYTW